MKIDIYGVPEADKKDISDEHTGTNVTLRTGVTPNTAHTVFKKKRVQLCYQNDRLYRKRK